MQDKQEIINNLLNYPTHNKLVMDYDKLKNWENQPRYSNAGNLVVDYFTLEERLATRMKCGISYYEFLENIEQYKNNVSITRLYNERPDNSHYKKARNAYKLYYGNPTIFKPMSFIRILNQLPPVKIALLDPTMGWGGRAVGGAVLNLPKYIGIDTNLNLVNPYANLIKFLRERSKTKFELFFQDSLSIDYQTMTYDAILTSYPYYNIEKYSNYKKFKTKREMNDHFYKPLTKKIYDGLQNGGYMALNVSPEIYEFIQSFMGECDRRIPLDCRNRCESYSEFVYIWLKP
jgi:hypothetical protein